MAELRIKLPDELEFSIKHVPNIEWSILASKLIKLRLDRAVQFQRIIAKSKLTERDVEELSDEINESLSKRYLE